MNPIATAMRMITNAARRHAPLLTALLAIALLAPMSALAKPPNGGGSPDAYVDVTGDAMTGNLNMQENAILMRGGYLQSPAAGILHWEGARVCVEGVLCPGAAPTYSAGFGLDLTGTQFSADTSEVQARVGGACAVGSAIRAIAQDGTVTCETDDDTTYAAGDGLDLSATTFSVDNSVQRRTSLPSCPAGSALRTLAATGAPTCEPDDDTLATLSCSPNQGIRWNGAAWVCSPRAISQFGASYNNFIPTTCEAAVTPSVTTQGPGWILVDADVWVHHSHEEGEIDWTWVRINSCATGVPTDAIPVVTYHTDPTGHYDRHVHVAAQIFAPSAGTYPIPVNVWQETNNDPADRVYRAWARAVFIPS